MSAEILTVSHTKMKEYMYLAGPLQRIEELFRKGSAENDVVLPRVNENLMR
jgi:hypothetical protein